MSNEAVADFFDGKPETHAQYEVVAGRIRELGPVETSVQSQISLGAQRKFAWFWLYNVTRKNPNGVLHLMLALDERIDDPHVRDITQLGKTRWNHQIVIRSLEDARSAWLGDLLERAHAYGQGGGRG
jgi:hypothetical protein